MGGGAYLEANPAVRQEKFIKLKTDLKQIFVRPERAEICDIVPRDFRNVDGSSMNTRRETVAYGKERESVLVLSTSHQTPHTDFSQTCFSYVATLLSH